MALGLGLGVTRLPIMNSGALGSTDDFIMTVRTTTPSESFTIPTTGTGYNYDVDWGDGNISTGQTGNASNTYAVAGDYEVKISGTFPRIYFNNGGDKAKVIEVKNLGKVGWNSFSGAFFGCLNMTSFTSGNTDTSSVVSMADMFNGCNSLTNYDPSGFNIEGLNNTGSLTNFATGTTIPTANYDALLINWASQTIFSGMAPNFGNSTFSSAGVAARQSLVDDDNMTITDGGAASLGSELVTNGTFDTDTAWNKQTGWTISGGTASNDGLADGNLSQLGVVESGTYYYVTLDVSGMTTGALNVRIGGTVTNDLSITSNGSYTLIDESDGTSFICRATSGFDGSVDNISVKEIL